MSLRAALVLALLLLTSPATRAHSPAVEQRLPTIGPAPEFTLTSQDDAQVGLRAYRGKVVAMTFIYTSCPDTCPMLTAKMAQVQDELGSDFGPKIAFISITVDPERDTPEVLKQYAQMFAVKFAGWAFLTGSSGEIRDVTRRYGVFVAKAPDGSVDHTALTSIIDRQGRLRVQYLGVRFDPEEFRRDLLSLLDED